MAIYPDWVMKFKKKGTYINHVKDKYYLYSAHSERVPGTNKIKRICDEYLGRITENEGLIPPKDKVKGVITLYEYGLSYTVFYVCSNIHKGLRKSFVKYGDIIMIASTLSFIYGKFSLELFQSSYLSLLYPEIDLSVLKTPAQTLGIERGTRMISEVMSRTFGDDLIDIRNHFTTIQKVKINNKLFLSNESNIVISLKNKYQISWEE